MSPAKHNNNNMKLPEKVSQFILTADSKVLATAHNNDVNVVPVSSIRIVDDKIWIINYFMGKTVANIDYNHRVALSCWKDGEGYQIKARATHITEGKAFVAAQEWIKGILPERVVKGLLVLDPTEVFDLAPVSGRAGMRVE